MQRVGIDENEYRVTSDTRKGETGSRSDYDFFEEDLREIILGPGFSRLFAATYDSLAASFRRWALCLLADEPYRGIAPIDAEDLTKTFVEISARGVAVVITGHEVPTLLNAADHVSWCTSGTTYELGSPAVATQHHAFRREYLGSWLYRRAS